MSVFLGTGAGGFGTRRNIVAGNYPYTVAAADFNGDGKPDLAVMNLDSDNVSILLSTCLSACQVVSPGIADGSFEAGAPWTAWTTQTSTQFGTPLCNTELCGTGSGTAAPDTGDNWAWFGGTPVAPEAATLGQSVTLAASYDLRLRFRMRIGAVTAPATDSLVVSVDGAPVATFAEPTVAEPAYTLREIDLSPLANGAAHALLFGYSHPDPGVASFVVDNVELVDCPVPALTVGDVTVAEGSAGTTEVVFTVTLSSASGRTVTAGYTMTNGTAIAGSDYLPGAGTLTFPPGAVTQKVSVPVVADGLGEMDETFFLSLANPAGASLADGIGRATILNDDVVTAAGRIADFDGDRRTDTAVYHEASGLWYVKPSSTGTSFAFGYGGPGFHPVPGDYDGDGITDVAVYHTATGLWFVRRSSTGATFTLGFGGPGYQPVPRDYDGDGLTDIAAYHGASGLWFVRQSSTETSFAFGYGGPGFQPVAADYDGDGRADIAVYHEATGLWFLRHSLDGGTFSLGYGGPGLSPVPRDYDGDGRADLAVYGGPLGTWFIRQSSTATTMAVDWGGPGYSPVPAEYDGDGHADVAVYHQQTGLWFIRQSATGQVVVVGYGGSGFVPVN